MTTARAIGPVRKSIRVKATPEKAFNFHRELGKVVALQFSIGSSPMQDAIIEPGAGGRWYEVGQDGSTCQWGEVLVWNPPDRLVLAWRITANWQFDPDLLTEVHVKFAAIGDSETEVTLEHRKPENYADAAADIAGISSPQAAGMLPLAASPLVSTRFDRSGWRASNRCPPEGVEFA